MIGQWVGPVEGREDVILMIDFDRVDRFCVGYFYLTDGRNLFSITGELKCENLTISQIVNLNNFNYVDLRTDRYVSYDDLVRVFGPGKYAKTANVTLNLSGEHLEVNWASDVDTVGSARLKKSKADLVSDYVADPNVGNWDDFKRFVLDLPQNRYIFRGQPNRKRLRTSFHRTERKNINKYLTNDIPDVHRNLSARTRHLFLLEDPKQNAAFLNLLQHHGYPTPLLDWTYSPFVAAFFAFRRFHKSENNEYSRIFMLDKEAWAHNHRSVSSVFSPFPHVSLVETLGINNDRMIPQQAVSLFTNIDDIEDYILFREQQVRISYLKVFDFHFSQKEKILRELNVMGITSGSLFPGLDGACEELKARYFGYENL